MNPRDFALVLPALAAAFAVIATGASLWADRNRFVDVVKGVFAMLVLGALVGVVMLVSMLVVSRRADTMPLYAAVVVGGSGASLILLGALVGRLGYRPGKGTDEVAAFFLRGMGAKSDHRNRH